MNRNEWEFPYSADKLCAAAKLKQVHHVTRQKWWADKKADVMASIKADGLEIDESQAAEFSKMSNYTRPTTVSIRDDLLRDLNECVSKEKEHHNKAEGYDAWIQVLSSQGQAMLALHQDDWLYFFGK